MQHTLEKFVEAFKGEEIKQFVDTLTGNDIKNFLIEVNRQVRELPPEEGGIYKGDRMHVGSCISPKGEIQERYLDKMADFLRSVDNKNDMAIGMYYLINYLHLFQDGNGRTSRFVYELMTNRDFKDFDDDFFRHKEGKNSSRAGFCEQKGIKDIVDANQYSGYAMYQYLTAMDLLPDKLKDSDLYCARTYVPKTYGGEVYISEKALEEGILTSEVRLVDRALKDNNESFSVGALTTLMMMKLKGKKVEDYNDCRCVRDFQDSTINRLVISIYDKGDEESGISDVLDDWSREDYLRAIRIADKVKEMLLDINMDMIQYPYDFLCENGKTFLDCLRTYTDRYEESVSQTISSNIRINPETRTFKHMDSLRAIIQEEQIELTSENIGVIELGKQTYSEQKDIKAKEEELARRNMMMQEKTDTIDFWNW